LIGGSALVSAAPTATVHGAITSVDIAATTSGPFEKVRIDLRFAVPDQAVAGDEFHLALPPQLMAAGPGFEVKDAAVATDCTNDDPYRPTHAAGSAFEAAQAKARRDVELVPTPMGRRSRSVTLSGGLPDRPSRRAAGRRTRSRARTNACWVVAPPQTVPGGSGTRRSRPVPIQPGHRHQSRPN
jgi:hypothetical protein